MAFDPSSQQCLRNNLFQTRNLFRWFLSFLFLCHSALCWSTISPISSGPYTTSIVSGFLSGDPAFPGVAFTDTGFLGGSKLGICLNHNGTLTSPTFITTSMVPTLALVAAGNFHGTNAVLDLAVALQKTKHILFFFNNGLGSFPTAPSTIITTSIYPTCIAVGDFKGNGKGDVVVGSYSSSSLEIFFHNGNGTFTAPTTIHLPSAATAVAVGDLNGDGHDDLAVAFGLIGQVGIFLNDGTGHFTPSGTYNVGTAGSFQSSLAIGMLTKSGLNDIAVTTTVSNQLSILLNEPASPGHFAAPVTHQTEYAPAGLTIADFAGDGNQSIAVTCEASSTANLFVGNGDGTFQKALSYSTCSAPLGIASGTFSGGTVSSYLTACFLGGTINPPSGFTSSTLLTQSSTITNPGQSVTFTATVSSIIGIPTGKVSFSIDGGTGKIVNLSASGQAAFSISSLMSGSHKVVATYLGSNAILPSSGNVTHKVRQNSTVMLTSSENPSLVHQKVTFTAVVSGPPGSSTPTGTVTFSIDGVQQGIPVNLINGHASFSNSTLSVGNHTIGAKYNGNANFLTSSKTLQQVVKAQESSTVALTSSANPSLINQKVTFTAVVSGPPGSPTPTGTVTFSIDGVQQGSPVNLINGKASFSNSTLSVGNHTIGAKYSGDANFLTSSSTLTQVVKAKESSTVALTSSANPSLINQKVTFTAVVSGPSGSPTLTGGSPTPTGTVTFSIDGVQQGSPVNLINGKASFSNSNLGIGNHTIGAKYNGDANFLTSTSILTQVVKASLKETTTVRLTSSVNPSLSDQKVIFNAVVSGPPGSPKLTGTVTFLIDGTAVSTVNLNNGGQASFSTSSLSIGSHTIAAQYSGDDNFLPSSSSLNQVVNSSIEPPRHFHGKQVRDTFATQTDIINVLSWKAPNSGSKPVEYRIYRNAGLTKLAAKVHASHDQFSDHNRRNNRTYNYYIVSVDDSGVQSDAVKITVKPR